MFQFHVDERFRVGKQRGHLNGVQHGTVAVNVVITGGRELFRQLRGDEGEHTGHKNHTGDGKRDVPKHGTSHWWEISRGKAAKG